MSIKRSQKFQRSGSAWENIVDFFAGKNRKRAKGGHNKVRRLTVDPLEERVLLTLSPATLSDQLVNQTAGIQTTGVEGYFSISSYASNKSVATNNSGDFVITWARNDPVSSETTLSSSLTESNIYARYYTDETQQIVLPESVLPANLSTAPQPTNARFTLIYGGNAVQKLSFTTAIPPGATLPTNIEGAFKLGIDLDGDGLLNPETEITREIHFDETLYDSIDPTQNPAALMEAALHELGGKLRDVSVETLGPRTFQFTFGYYAINDVLPAIRVVEPAWNSGYLPGYTLTHVRTPSIITNSVQGGMLVSPTDAAKTALSIKSSFAYYGLSVNVVPVYQQKLSTNLDSTQTLHLRTFNITFIEESAKTDLPQLIFGSIKDINGNFLSPEKLVDLNTSAITTIKEPSPEFRVNPIEVDDPYTVQLDYFDQTAPEIAMDIDGDFVITWQSEVPESVNPGSVYDVFARRFSPAGLAAVPNLVIDTHQLAIPEGTSKEFTVKLASKPVSTVTVSVVRRANGDEDLAALTENLTFTPSNWDTPQIVTINAAVDLDILNGSAFFDVSANGYTLQTVTASEIDANNLIVSSNSLSVVEAGVNTFTVKLAGEPAADVTVDISGLTDGYADLLVDTDPSTPGDQTTLTFTAGNWDIPQTVTLNANKDSNLVDGMAELYLTAPGYSYQIITINEIDIDEPGIILSSNELSVSEEGVNTFTVQLSAPPVNGYATVQITRRADGDRDFTTDIETISFTDADWDIPQTVTVAAARDVDNLNGIGYFSIGVPTDPEYRSQTLTVREIDVPRLIVSDPNLIVPEGGSAFFTVSIPDIYTAPADITIIPIDGGDTDLTLTAEPLTFTINPGQTGSVQVSAAADPDALNGTRSFLIYSPGYPTQLIVTTELDLEHDPIAELIISDLNIAVPEGGDPNSFTFTVTLNSAPTIDTDADGFGDVTLTLIINGDPNLTLDTTELTFSADPAADDYWDRPQEVTITAEADNDNLDGTATISITSTDPAYGPAPDVINVTEIDARSIVISNHDLTVIEGSSNTFTVALGGEPAGNVTVTITEDDLGDADLTLPISPLTINFTPDDWNVPQTITVSAARDIDSANGTRDFRITSNTYRTEIVTATELDTPDLVIAPTLTRIIEGGSQTFTIALPTGLDPANVDIQMQSVDDPDGSISFTRDDSVAGLITVTVTAAEDDANLANEIANFIISAPGYGVGAATSRVIDNDGSPVVITSGVSVEEGGYKIVDVKLAYQPTEDVTVTITRDALGDADLAFYDPATRSFTDTVTLTYTTSNWNQPQKITVYAAQDADDVNSEAAFNISAVMGSTTFAQTITFTATEIEDDFEAVIVSTDFVPVLEGSSGIFTVKLPHAPTEDSDGDGVNDVTVTITKQFGSDGSIRVIPTTLVFTADNWDIPQRVKILADSDADTVEGVAELILSAPLYNSAIVAVSEKEGNQGVRPLGSAFQVNTFTVDSQFQPAIGMDRDGNFVIAWSNEGQTVSYFNGIVAQRFNRDGDRLGSEFMVSAETTWYERDPFVGVSPDGHFVISWVGSEVNEVSQLQAKVYDPQGRVIVNQHVVEYGYNPTVAWDTSNDNYIISFDIWDLDIGGDHNIDNDGGLLIADFSVYSGGVYAIGFSIPNATTPDAPAATSDIVFPMFRVNSAETNDPFGNTIWPYYQGNNSIAMDADGDITGVFDGYGGSSNGGSLTFSSYYDSFYDLDAFINSHLWYNQKYGLQSEAVMYMEMYTSDYSWYDRIGTPATDADLAVLKAALSAYWMTSYSEYLGDPNGIMYSQFDASYNDPNLTVVTNSDDGIASDVIINEVDGNNQSYLIVLDGRSIGGGFTLRVSNPYTTNPGFTDVGINPAYNMNRGVINIDDTRGAIESALNGVIGRVGQNGYPNTTPYPISVRSVTQQEILDRDGTDWDIKEYGLAYNSDDHEYVVYEVTVGYQARGIKIGLGITGYDPNAGMKRPNPTDPNDPQKDINAAAPQCVLESTANLGSAQQYPTIAMQPNGSFVVVWSQYTNNTADTTVMAPNTSSSSLGQGNINFRTFTESTDTAGPLATDFRLTDGTRLNNGGQVLSQLQYIIVGFDENMSTTGTGSVTNIANWALMKNGTKINGGINKIYYGLNMASQWGALNGLSFTSTNKYEAVLILDGNGVSSGITALSNGNYQIVALNSLKDIAGNPLGRTGYAVNGANFSRTFDIAALTGNETIVNTGTAGEQNTSPNQQAVANDGNGRYVATWISYETGQEGVWAKVYTNTWTGQNNLNRQSAITTLAEIRISDDPYAANAAVAMDADGDFVVTWSSNKNDPTDMFGTSWDIYARRYNADGTALGEEFMVNTETSDIQRFSSVAMDADGDFMIAWQSFDQDGSGYGVYAQRYSPSGEVLGGTNEAQLISLIGRPVGTFKLQWSYDVNGDDEIDSSEIFITDLITLNSNNTITFNGVDYSIENGIKEALTKLGTDNGFDLQVEVTASSATDFMVRFVKGDFGNKDLLALEVLDPVLTGDSGRRIEITTQVDGKSGEILVNDTTDNDQMNPSVSASLQGQFVVAWTGYGQNGDTAYESNIYAKQFNPNDPLRPTSQSTQTPSIPSSDLVYGPHVVTADDPANHIVQADTGYDGVVQVLINGSFFGTGSLLLDRTHILTAAHVVADERGELYSDNTSVVFVLATGNVVVNAKKVIVHPDFTGDPFTSPDIAIIELMQTAPAGVAGFDIYRGPNPINQVFDFYGFGYSGTGDDGDNLAYGTKRHGQNLWELNGNAFGWSNNLLGYDFDNGQDANDAFGELFNMANTGLGDENEANSAGGDSGGPCFIGGAIAAVVTGGATYGEPIDVNNLLDSSFGEISVDTSVSAYADWIDSVVVINSGPEFLVNQITVGVQQSASVAVDANGDFVVTWTSYGQDGTGSGAGAGANGLNGVYARRFDAEGSVQSDDFKVNTFGANDQQHPQIAMDADGDFVIAWESFQDRPMVGSGLPDSPNSFGIYAQRYAATSKIGTITTLGLNGEIGSEFHLNSTTDGDQRYPSIAVDATGDLIAVWSGGGLSDNQGVYYQRFNKAADDAGPFVTDVQVNDTTVSTWKTIYNGATITNPITQVLINIDENLSAVGGTGGLHSWSNLNNWKLTLNGATLFGGISGVQFSRNPTTYQYEALVSFDGNFDTAGIQALGQGAYTLTISDNIQDTFGNALDGNLDGTAGGAYVLNFTIDTRGIDGTEDDPVGDTNVGGGTTLQQNGRTFPETPGAVAVDADGHNIVTWTAFDTDTQRDRVYFQIFDADGTRADLPSTGVDSAPVTPVTPGEMLTDNQRFASVSCDADGDFVVTWTEINSSGYSDIYARRYNSMGQSLGNAFRVNTHTAGNQMWSGVDMDSQGDFVITWSSFEQENNGQPGVGYGVYATRYNSAGQVEIPEFQVNVNTSGDQFHSSVALMEDGWFVITFESAGLESTNHQINIRAFDPSGLPTLSENFGYFISSNTADSRYPDIAATPLGDNIAIAWQSLENDGNGWEVKAMNLYLDRTGVESGLGLSGIYPLTTVAISVNSTRTSDQKYASVAMDNNGAFVVSWSGFGNRTGQSDNSGDGVFYQRYSADGNRISGERKANVATNGNQYISSVASDANGNVVIAFTGVGDTINSTTIYKTVTSMSVAPQADSVGATITDILLPDRTRIWDGSAFTSGASITKVIVVLSEDMLQSSTGTNSIINSTNWALYRNGSEIVGAISNVTFAYNPQSRKYEATVTFDGDGISGSTIAALSSGEYQLVLKGNVVDKATAGNQLNKTAFNVGNQNFVEHFVISPTSQYGTELLINQQSNAQYIQTLGHVDYGTYNNMSRESTRSLAMDNDGDFAVVWTSYGQDDPNDPNGAGVYMRIFDRNNVPLTNDIKVNSFTAGHQCNASIVMDADGDLIVTWASQGQDADGSWGIYAQRFSSVGQKIGSEIRVNTNYISDQINPSLAMNDSGSFVIVWATKGQNFSYFNDIHAQLFDDNGQKIGDEFRVNSVNLPGDGDPAIGGNEVNPVVAMARNGNFAVVWEQVIWNNEGVQEDTYLVCRLFDNLGNPRNSNAGNNLEFRVDASATGQNFLSDDDHANHQQPCDIGGVYSPSEYRKTARNPYIVMDDSGNFLVAWESFEDNDIVDGTTSDYPGREILDSADSYGIYFRRFSADGTAMTTGDHNANLVLSDTPVWTDGNQLNASLALDADGDMAIVWSGNGSTIDSRLSVPPTIHDSNGIFVRNFSASTYGNGNSNIEGAPVNVGSTANRTIAGVQDFPTIAMTTDGEYVIVWSGNGIGDQNGIFARRYTSSVDNAGPMVSDFLLPDGSRIYSNNQISQSLSTIKVVFDEDMMTTGTGSVLNKANYRLLKNGADLTGGITSITFALDPATNKYIATLAIDANGLAAGIPEMNDGQYQLIVLNSVRDKAGNPLLSTGLNPNGEVQSRILNFTVADDYNSGTINGSGTTASLTGTATATNANGDKVVVWTSTTPGNLGIYAKLYQTTWTDDGTGRKSTVTPKTEILITNNSTTTDVSVAMDADGDFVVTWSQKNAAGTNYDVFARRYSALGQAIGSQFAVNNFTTNDQRNAKAAMDVDGDFVITWQSYGQDDSGYGIFAQRFDIHGNRMGGLNEAQTVQFVSGWMGSFKLSWDHDNNPSTPDVTTDAISFVGNIANTAAKIEEELSKSAFGAEVTVVEEGSNKIVIQFTGASGNKNQPPLWISNATKSSGDATALVEVATAQEGNAGEFRVNDTTLGSQTDPSIAMSADGNFVISWTSEGQDGDGVSNTNIYAKRFVKNEALYMGTSVNTSSNLGTNLIAGAHYQTYMVSVDDPANHAVAAGQGADGIVQVLVPGGYGSGTLLSTGDKLFILTAAHVVWNAQLNQPRPAQGVSVAFDMPTGRVIIPAAAVYVNPGYNGDPFFNGHDIAVIQLTVQAPDGAESYDINRNAYEIGQVGTKYGYGLIGTGLTGSVTPSGDNKYTGQNVYESLGSLLGMSDDLLAYDFDNGLSQNDAFGILFGKNNLGLGLNEASAAPGDSGGPTIINNKIVSVCTGGLDIPGSWDVIPGTNSSFGDFAVDTRVSNFAEWIDTITSIGGNEFLVNESTATVDNISNDQKWSSVSMDSNGDFVVSWTSYGQDNLGTGYGAGDNGVNGIYARRYHLSAIAMSDVFQVNTLAEGNQQHSQVQMDSDGDFVIAWETDHNSGNFNVDAKRYARTELLGNALYGANGEIGGEFSITSVAMANQAYPRLAVDYTGDFLTVWSNGQNVYQKQFTRPTDDSGPIVTDVFMQSATAKLLSTGINNNIIITSNDLSLDGLKVSLVSGATPSVAYDSVNRTLKIYVVVGTTTAQNVVDLINGNSIVNSIFSAALDPNDGSAVASPNNGTGKVTAVSSTMMSKIFNSATVNATISKLIFTFSEDMLIGSNGLTNTKNWTLVQNNKAIAGAISSIDFSHTRNPITGKFEATITFSQPLTDGIYVLTLLDNVRDQFNNRLDGDYSGTPGVNYILNFTISSGSGLLTPDLPNTLTVPGEPADDGVDIPVNTITVGNQNDPVVASNDSGAFVVVWTSTHNGTSDIVAQRFDKYGRTMGTAFTVNTYTAGEQVNPDVAMDAFGNFVITWSGVGTGDTSGVYARLFDTFGTPQAEEFLVNQYHLNIQNQASVAMDGDGDFVVAWNSYGQDSDKDGIFARRYDVIGQPKGNEFQVNSTVTNRQDNCDVAMDQNGNFAVVWESNLQDGSAWGIYGQRYDLNGNRLSGEFRLNNYTNDKQTFPRIAMDQNGDFAAVWSSFGQDGSGYGVYGRRYNAAGAALDANEFRANQQTLNWQYQPDIGMDLNGNYVITWAASGQDNDITNDYGIFARMFRADGTENGTLGEWRINATTAGNQVTPAIAVDADGDFTVVWVGPDLAGTGIYARVVAANLDTYLPIEPISTTGQFRSNSGYVQSTTAIQPEPIGLATFNLTGPASGTYSTGQAVTISWTAGNVPANGVISLCLDADTNSWNGNEKWIVIDAVAATNGDGSYTFNVPQIAAGKYYIGGYMYDSSTKIFTNSHLSTPITISAPVVATPTFAISGPASGTYTVGQAVTINWTAGNVPANGVISLCLDADTRSWNGNEKWIEIDQVAAANGDGSYTFNVPQIAAGNYYVGGYMYNPSAKAFINSHLSTPITVSTTGNTNTGKPTFALSGPTSGTYSAGQPVTITWSASNIANNSVISLAMDSDTKWNGNEKWIEIDQVAAANGNGSYSFDPAGYAPGTYYIAGYMYDTVAKTATNSHLTSGFNIPAPSFALTGPTSGTYTQGQEIAVTWAVAGVSSNSVISLALDTDNKWNGNEKWIEIDKVAAVNGNGSYSFTPTGFASGTYYVAGYMYNTVAKTAINSHLTSGFNLTVPTPTFTLTAPASSTYTAGQSITFNWTASNVAAGSVISLCLDKDTTAWNGNEKWIEIDQVAAANGSGSYSFNSTGITPGTYYLGGYMYDSNAKTFTPSHLMQSITIGYGSSSSQAASLASASNASSSFASSLNAAGTDGASLTDSDSSASTDIVLASNTLVVSKKSQRTTNASNARSQEEDYFAQSNKEEEISAIDRIFQDNDKWLDYTLES